MYTRFFCAPYRQLAAGAVSYSAMYHAFERMPLPESGAAPFSVALSPLAATIPGNAARALPVIELLLTGNPVCIVGADATTMTERLAYIDTVMSLLPYGMRARMAASTWAKSTYRLHPFRLFFSDAPRRATDPGVEDHVVRWTPDMRNITRAPELRVPENYGEEYRQWLQRLLEPSVTTDLAEETKARAFKAADINEMLDSLLAKQQKHFWTRSSKRRETAVKNEAVTPRTVVVPDPRYVKSVSQDQIENLIDAVAKILNNTAEDTQDIDFYLGGLGVELDRAAPLSDESRERYRERIANHKLLRDGLPLARDKKVACYKVLLRVAFGEQIGYHGYCRIEAMLHNRVPDKPLLQAIVEKVDADHYQDLRVAFLVRYHLKRQKYPKSEFTPIQLITIAGDLELRPDHAVLCWEAMIASIGDKRPEERERVIVPLLRECGFLAFELQARASADLGYQVQALLRLLTTVYGGFLGPQVFLDILAGSRRRYPTLALLLAVCRLSASEYADDLLTAFMSSLTGSHGVPEDTRKELARFGWGAPGGGIEETTVDPGPAPPTRVVEVSLSKTEARAYANTLQPANPPKGKRRHGRPRPGPRPSWLVWGSFPVSEQKSQESDDT
jgi:hypothetical protein